MPDEYDQAEAEANHLIHSSDSDSDGKLSKEEVIEKYDVFVGSQATDFGEALVKHDEFWNAALKCLDNNPANLYLIRNKTKTIPTHILCK